MKKNAVPELDAAWWKKNQADGLPSAKDLEKALEAHAKAWKTLSDDETAEALADCLKALDEVENTAKKVRAEAAKAVKNPPKGKFDAEDMGHTGDALDGFKPVIEAARKAARDKVDEDGSLLGQVDRYESYLKGAMAKLKTGPMMFAFGAGGTPQTLRLMMHRSTKGASMANKLRDFGLKKLTYGVATPDPARPTTILLTLEHAPLQGLTAKFKRVRKLFGPLPFDRMVVMVGGVEQPDEVDPTDPPDDEAPALTAATTAPSATTNTVPGTKSAPVPPASASPGPTSAMSQWQAARGHAVEQLHKLGAAIVAAKDPDAKDAVQRLQALAQSLPATPAVPNGVAEVERFVQGSEDLTDLESPNPFGLDLGLRAPLLKALAGLRAAAPGARAA